METKPDYIITLLLPGMKSEALTPFLQHLLAAVRQKCLTGLKVYDVAVATISDTAQDSVRCCRVGYVVMIYVTADDNVSAATLGLVKTFAYHLGRDSPDIKRTVVMELQTFQQTTVL